MTDIATAILASLPTDEEADRYRQLYKEHVKVVDVDWNQERSWKGPCEAIVDAEIANDVARAMDFMGSIVDDMGPVEDGKVRLYSEGYWAHGF